MTDSDPLRNADIGETVTVQKTVTLNSIDLAAEHYRHDRFPSDIDITNIEILNGDSADPNIQITLTADITKQLPPHWDHHTEPVTDTETTRTRPQKWAHHIKDATGLLIGVGIAIAISTLMIAIYKETPAINGTPIPQPTLGVDILSVVPIILIIMLAVVIGARGALPGIAHGGRR